MIKKLQADLTWQQQSKKELLQTRIADITEITSTSPHGESGTFIVLDAPDWVITIPVLTKDNKDFFIIVEQFRHGANCISKEFPGGVVNKNETPENAAKRELLEETGYKANKLVHLGSISPNPAIMSNQVHFYAALNLENTKKQNLDDDEFVNFSEEPVEKIYGSMGKEPYIHALMCAALDLFKRYYI